MPGEAYTAFVKTVIGAPAGGLAPCVPPRLADLKHWRALSERARSTTVDDVHDLLCPCPRVHTAVATCPHAAVHTCLPDVVSTCRHRQCRCHASQSRGPSLSSNSTRECPPSPFEYYKGMPSLPSNITREYPPSLLILHPRDYLEATPGATLVQVRHRSGPAPRHLEDI